MSLDALKKATSAVLALALGAASIPLGCATNDDYTLVPHPPTSADSALPDAPDETVEQLRDCVKRLANGAGGDYHVQFEVDVNPDGQALDARVQGSTLPEVQIERCMLRVLGEMKVPPAIVDPSSLAPVSRSPQSRAAMGYALPNPIVVLAGFMIIYGMSVMVQISLRVMLTGAAVPAITAPMATATTSAPPIATAVTDATTEALPEDPNNARRKCDEERTLCLHTALADLQGGKYNHSRCDMCHEYCMQNHGEWPSKVKPGRDYLSCEYWLTAKR